MSSQQLDLFGDVGVPAAAIATMPFTWREAQFFDRPRARPSVVGVFDCPQNRRIIGFAQDFDIGHYAMPANNSRKILNRGKEWDFIVERDNFFVRLAHSIAVPLDLLRPGNQESEISCLSQLRQFSCFRGRQDFRLQTHRLEMLSRAPAAGKVQAPTNFV